MRILSSIKSVKVRNRYQLYYDSDNVTAEKQARLSFDLDDISYFGDI